VDKIAGVIHHHKTKAFLETFIKKAKNKSKEVQGFVLGFLCHYALDSTAHPYIFHVTGNYSKKTKHYRGNHLRLERGIDTLLIKEKGLNPKYYRVNNHFPLRELSSDLVSTFTNVMKSVYSLKDVGLLYAQGYKDFVNNFKYMVYDPTGFKKVVYTVVDAFTTGSLSYKRISFKTDVDDFDIMNRENNTWLHPVTGEEHTESFDDLYDIAKQKALNLIKGTLEYFNSNDESVFKLIENISYDTGLECEGNNEMKYINSIFN
jgi:hypothetical protein